MILSFFRLYATYTKRHSATNQIYVGRTSGWVLEISRFWAEKIVRKRDINHHKNKEGYLDAELDRYSIDKNAIRGREQQLIDSFKTQNRSGNEINGISQRNKKRLTYFLAALAAFSDIAIILFVYFYFLKS